MEYQILMLFKALRIIKIFDYITLLGDTKVLLFIILSLIHISEPTRPY